MMNSSVLRNLSLILFISYASGFVPATSFFSRHVQRILPIAGTALPDPGEWENKKSAPAEEFTDAPDIVPADDMAVPFESQSHSPERMLRMQKEEETKSRFLHGDELVDLRKYIQNLELDLIDAKETRDTTRIQDLTKAIYESKNLDAEYIYSSCLEQAEAAEKLGELDEAKEYREEALEARNCLPQFQLSGLWVGKYGDHGYEMINVTYVGDLLIASKVTGDQNVPKGEVTFTADLSPFATTEAGNKLETIELSAAAAKQWGNRYLTRFPGKGQVASEGFVNNQFIDGQLILVGEEYFSYAWVPIGHQIFFGRPSAQLTLKMLKQSQMTDYGAVDVNIPNEISRNRAFAQRCYEESEMLIDDHAEGDLCFLVDDEDYFCQEGCFE